MNTIKTPATLVELGDMAHEMGVSVVHLLEMLPPIPIPRRPAGYTLAEDSDDYWSGQGIIKRGWIITPVWNSTTDTHSLDVWLAEHYAPTYANLSPGLPVRTLTS